MENFNDYIQLDVIKYLDLKDQLNLFEATKEEPTNRWASNICSTWRNQQRFDLYYYELSDVFNQHPGLLEDFLSVVSPTVKKLGLFDVTLNMLQGWTNYNFPKMRSLEYKFSPEYFDYFGNFDDCNKMDVTLLMQLFGRIFPGLNSIIPSDPFDLKYLTYWMDLRKVYFHECTVYSLSKEFDKIIEKLQKLEELEIHLDELTRDQFKMLVCLPKLRTISCDFYHLYDTINVRANDIEKIVIGNGCFYEIFGLRNCKNLRQLTLGASRNITMGNVLKLIEELPLLERLDIETGFLKAENELWETVDRCPSLKILNISDTELNEVFFSFNRRQMDRVLCMRSTPLTLHCDATDKVELIRLKFQHPNLKVSFERLDVDVFVPEVKIRFYSLAM